MQTSFLKINVGQQIILLNLKHSRLVLPLVELQSIPDKDPAIEGILNYHGQALPVYSLAQLIAAPAFKYSIDTPLLLCEVATGLLGIIVSEVHEVVNLANERIQAPDFNHVMPYVEGIFESDSWSAWVLDLEQLMRSHYDNLVSKS